MNFKKKQGKKSAKVCKVPISSQSYLNCWGIPYEHKRQTPTQIMTYRGQILTSSFGDCSNSCLLDTMRRNYLFLFLFIFLKPQKYIWRPTFISPLFSQYNDKLFPCFFLYVYRKEMCESQGSKVYVFLFYWKPLWGRWGWCACVHLSLHTYTHKPDPHTHIHMW